MSHMTRARTHDENRFILCGICYRKESELRSFNEVQLEQIKILVDISYNLEDSRFQSVLCRTCAKALSAHTKNPQNPGRKLSLPKYSNLNPPPKLATRQFDGKACPCTVCDIAR